MKLTIMVAFATLFSSVSCRKSFLKKLNNNLLQQFNDNNECFHTYSIGSHPTKDTFTDVSYQVHNITQMDIYYDGVGIAGYQVTYGNVKAPLRGTKSMATKKTIKVPKLNSVNQVTGTVGFIQDSVNIYTNVPTNTGILGNGAGGKSFDTSETNDPAFCRLRYISGSADQSYAGRSYIKTITWHFYCCTDN